MLHRLLRTRRAWSVLLPALAALALSACSSGTLSPKVVRSVGVVRRSQVPTRDQVFLYTFGQNMAGAYGGLVGALIAHGATADERALLLQKMREARIDPGLMVAEEWERQLRAADLFAVTAPGAADARFELDVRSVGLRIPHGFATRLYPALAGEARLIGRNGKVLWREATAGDGNDDRVAFAGRDFDDYMRDPAVLRDAFAKAAQVFCRELLITLRETREDSLLHDRAGRTDAQQRQLEDEQDRRTRASEQAEEQELRATRAERKRLEQQERAARR